MPSPSNDATAGASKGFESQAGDCLGDQRCDRWRFQFWNIQERRQTKTRTVTAHRAGVLTGSVHDQQFGDAECHALSNHSGTNQTFRALADILSTHKSSKKPSSPAAAVVAAE
jgi:hypothetical protein